MNAWSWSGSEVVPVIVTAVGADGTNLYCQRDLRPGRVRATTIELPEGAQAVTITRLVRERVDLGQVRVGRRVARPPRPTWRDDSAMVMWWRAVRAQRDALRVLARRKGK
ncbi:MAG: hypothetical protein ACRDQ0_18055 [Pseudonocardia sp.]